MFLRKKTLKSLKKINLIVKIILMQIYKNVFVLMMVSLLCSLFFLSVLFILINLQFDRTIKTKTLVKMLIV